MTTALRVVLQGPEAELGSVAAADVARLLLGVERAVARAAAGRTAGPPAGPADVAPPLKPPQDSCSRRWRQAVW